MIRVGIPRALLYYQYFPAWKTFFEELGAEVVVSPPTTQVMLAGGSARVVSDTCLPVKVFLGHVLWLAENCDRLFIPAVRSVEPRVYNCSKFLGLPDMTKAVVPELAPLLETEFDINKRKSAIYRDIYAMARSIESNPFKVHKAGKAALQTLNDYRAMMAGRKLRPTKAIELMYPELAVKTTTTLLPAVDFRGTVAVIGHPYLIYDEFINHRLLQRLERTGSRIVVPEMIPFTDLQAATTRVTGGAYWTYENEVAGAGGYYLEDRVDGVIGLMAFGCGPDSLMMDMVRRYAAEKRSVPFMSLTLEEHTAEAGVITRLEAFTDMIYRRKKTESIKCVSESLI